MVDLDESRQGEWLRRIADEASRRGLVAAPVGSVYFLHRGVPRARTKDIDTVIHDANMEPASMEQLEAIGSELGKTTRGNHNQEVVVTIKEPDGDIQLELIRGKSGTDFFPRSLLKEAASRGTVEGNILWYPIEYVILLKADAAVDKELRSRLQNEFQEKNRLRAEAFRQDVIEQVSAALRRGTLRTDYLIDGLRHIKESRRDDVASLIERASAGRIRFKARR